jgi:hypothetical protein
MRIHVFTIAAGNYLPRARVIAWYRNQIEPTIAEQGVSLAYGFGVFADGTPITLDQRLVSGAR